MRLRTARVIKEGSNGIYAIVALSVTVIVLAYSSVIGSVSILVMYGVWFPVFAIASKRFISRPFWMMWSLVLPTLCILSTFWSDYPAVSLRGGIQYLTVVLCSVVAARIISMRDFCLGISVGVVIVLCASILKGGYSYDIMDRSYSFTGYFASKNQVGLYASIGIFYSFSGLYILRDRGRSLVVYLLCIAVSLYALIVCRSATSILTLSITLVFTSILFVVQRLPRLYRRATTIVAIAALPVLMVIAYIGNADNLVLNSFGKDSSLTGRTYLWGQGIQYGMDSPFWGLGYQAFWVQGRIAAERLWYEFYIGTRDGFHFHNAYVETFVELGLIGLLTVVSIMVMMLWRSYSAMKFPNARRPALIAFGTTVLLLSRSNAELDFLWPFGIGTFLLNTFVNYNAQIDSLKRPGRKTSRSMQETAPPGQVSPSL